LNNISLVFISAAIALFISACENTNTSNIDVNTTIETKNMVISGSVIDGYISGAAVYLDLNINGYWDNTEPKVISSSTGSFSFDSIELEIDKLVPVVSVSGVDIVTKEPFGGKLRNIIDVNSSSRTTSINITPLTDLISTHFLEGAIQDYESLLSSRKTIGLAYNVAEEDVEKSPMAYAGLFAKTQEIQNTKSLLEISAIKAIKDDLSSSELEILRMEIKKAIVMQINRYGYIDIAYTIVELEQNLAITIPQNEKDFIVSQAKEIENALYTFALNKPLTVTNLNNFQWQLYTKEKDIYKLLKDSNASDTLNIMDINISVLSESNTTSSI